MKNELIKQIREKGIEGIDEYLNIICLKWFAYGFGLASLIWTIIVIKS